MTQDFFVQNRKWLQKRLEKNQVFCLAAHAQMQRSRDTSFFEQNRDFYYFCGVNEPDWTLVLTKDEEFLIRPKKSRVEIIFDGDTGTDEITEISGVSEVLNYQLGWQRLSKILQNSKEVQTVLPTPHGFVKATPNPAAKKLARQVKAKTKAKIVSVHPLVHGRRAIKQPEEIAKIKKAISITGLALEKVRKKKQKFENEKEVASLISSQFLMQGGDSHSYDPIVAGGNRACTLHYTANDSQLDKSQLLLIDVGAQFEFYASDITRTISLSKPTIRQKQVHQAVDTVRAQAIDLIQPGLKFSEYFDIVDDLMGKELMALGLIDNNITKNIRQYFPHGVSHMLGLDVHDVSPDSREFAAGMVLTVEPGIYIKEEGLGIRIEDDVLVTETGAANLSQSISRALE